MSWCPERRPALGALAAPAALALLAAALPAPAAEWTWGGSLGARLERISNAPLATPAVAATRRSLSAGFDLAARDAAWDATARADYSNNESNLRSQAQDGHGVSLALRRRFERDTLGLTASLRGESTLASELIAAGASNARSLGRRETLSLAPNWQRSLGERLTLTADAALDAVAVDPRAAGQADSRSLSLSAGLRYALSPRTELRVTARRSAIRTEPFSSDSDTTALTLGIQYQPDERWTLSGEWGPSSTRTVTASQALLCPVQQIFCDLGLVPFEVLPTEQRRSSAAAAWNATASYRAGERTTFMAQAAQASSPAVGGGPLSQTRSASLAASHRLGEHLSASADAGETSATTVVSGSGARTVTRRAGASLSWQLDERVFLEGGLRWQRSQIPGGESPESTMVFLGLRYELARRVLRRRRATPARPSPPESRKSSAPGSGTGAKLTTSCRVGLSSTVAT